jgi:hypothetical protein
MRERAERLEAGEEDRLAPWHAQVDFVMNGSVALSLGLLTGTLGRLEDADAFFAEAEAKHECIRAPYWLAVTRVDRARMLLGRDRPGDSDRAFALLAQARDAAREYGFAGVERRAAALLARV